MSLLLPRHSTGTIHFVVLSGVDAPLVLARRANLFRFPGGSLVDCLPEVATRDGAGIPMAFLFTVGALDEGQ